MTNTNQILSQENIKLYCKKFKYPIDLRGKTTILLCPFCGNKTAQLVGKTHLIACLNSDCSHKDSKFTLVSIVRKVESNKNKWSKDKIVAYIRDLFSVKILTPLDYQEIDQKFNYYVKKGFSLCPVAPNDKAGIESEWQNKPHFDKQEWLSWIKDGLNVSINCGLSKKTVIDIDQKPIPEEIKKLMGNTLIEESKRGFHLFYNQDQDFPKSSIGEFILVDKKGKEYVIKNPNYSIKLNDKNTTLRKMEIGDMAIINWENEPIEVKMKSYLKIDIENSNKEQGAQVVIYPSICDGFRRKFINENDIIDIPKEFKDYLLAKLPKKEIVKETGELISDDFKLPLIENGEGRNNFLFRYACILRKQMPINEVEMAVSSINQIICQPPLERREIHTIIQSTNKYSGIENQETNKKVINYLKEVKESSHRNIERVIYGDNRLNKDEKHTLDTILASLVSEEKIIKKRNIYIIKEDMDWKDTFMDVGVPINFKMPYFHDVANFHWADLILIASQNKFGKSTLAVNILKRLVSQGIKPYYAYSESGGRWAKTSRIMGMKESDFFRVHCFNPEKLILKPHAITIYDWVKPMGDDFSKMSATFGMFTDQLDRTQGILICFVQLKENDSFFAPNLISEYPALVSKYLYSSPDGLNTYFQITDVRDPIKRGKQFKIPCVYNWDTKEVLRTDEINGNKPNNEEILKDEKEE